MEKTIFEVKQLNASYGQEVILKNLDFSIKEGEVIGIIGESGIGKSTFLECLLGNIHQKVMMNASEMKFLEENWLTLSSKKRRDYLRQDIGIIFQNGQHSIDPLFTIGQQLEEIMLEANPQKIIEALKMVQLEEKVLQLYPHELSGGMLQRVMIAMAFINHPKLIIADEPFSALDVPLQMEMMQLIVHLAKQYRTATIMVTHQRELAYKFCTKVLTLEEGELVAQKEDSHKKFNFNRLSNEKKETFFQLKHVTSHYKDENVILKNLTVDIPKYEVTGIIGHSGAGKTTLVKLILNYYPKNLYDGEIKINGKQNIDISSEELYKDIAFVQKNDFLIEGNILENIKLARNLHLTEKLRKSLGFNEDFLRKYLAQSNQIISEGEKQRIDLARFLVKTYSVYIFDEPTSNLDPIKAKEIMDYILSIKDAIVIVITHDQNPEILEEFDQIIVL